MAWYVVAAVNVTPGGNGVSTATVVQYSNAADFQSHTGFAPGSSVDPIPGQASGGYPDRSAAQAAADRYNKSPASGRQSGTLPNPNADTVLPPNFHVPNPLSAVESVGSFLSRLTNPHTWLRVAEGIVGVAFLIIGLNALLKQTTGVDVAGSAVKAAKMVK